MRVLSRLSRLWIAAAVVAVAVPVGAIDTVPTGPADVALAAYGSDSHCKSGNRQRCKAAKKQKVGKKRDIDYDNLSQTDQEALTEAGAATAAIAIAIIALAAI